ncbi:MAG: HlyD family type I secretion periplasmic adaptor subunit [Pseudomonadota bacterium]
MTKNFWDKTKPIIIGFFTLSLLFIFVIAWGLNTRLSGAIIGSGFVQIDEIPFVINHNEGGIVHKVYVSNGQLVQKGELLVSLKNSELNAELASIEDELVEILTFEARIESEIAYIDSIKISKMMEKYLYTETLNNKLKHHQQMLVSNLDTLRLSKNIVEKKIQQLKNQITGIRHQIISKKEKLIIIEKEVQVFQTSYDKKLVNYDALAQIFKEKIDLQEEIDLSTSLIKELQEKVSEHQFEILASEEKHRNDNLKELIKLQPEKTTLIHKRESLNKKISNLNIYSPIKGKVHDLKVSGENYVIQAAKPIMHVISHEDPKNIQVKIDSRDIDSIYIGQSSLLKFHSFNIRSTPMINGMVKKISPDIYFDTKKNISYYHVQIMITAEGFKTLDNKAIVQGMPVDSFIKTVDRTPIDYILSPLLEYVNKAFR